MPRVLATGTGHVHVSGTATAAGTSVPVSFKASVTLVGVEGELEVEVTTTVDPRRFGMSRGLLGVGSSDPREPSAGSTHTLTCFPRLLIKTAINFNAGQQTMRSGASIRVYPGN